MLRLCQPAKVRAVTQLLLLHRGGDVAGLAGDRRQDEIERGGESEPSLDQQALDGFGIWVRRVGRSVFFSLRVQAFCIAGALRRR